MRLTTLFLVLALSALVGALSQFAMANGGNPTAWVPGLLGQNGLPCGAQQVPQWKCEQATGICRPDDDYPHWCTQECRQVGDPPHWEFRCQSPDVSGGW